MSELMTLDQMSTVLPKGVRGALTQDMVDSINATMNDVQLSQNFRDNLLSYTGVMKDGKFKMQAYIDAVRYISYKLMGDSNIAAYTKTFPDRYQTLINKGVDRDGIYQYASAYNRTKLVNLIFEQTLIPTHILNADLYQKALNTQAELMISSTSDKVRTDAANSILTHLKAPEVKKMELDITTNQDSSVNDLREATMELVRQQRQMIENNSMSAQQIAHTSITTIDGDVVDD